MGYRKQEQDQIARAWWASPYLLLSLTALFWSANWIIGRAVHESIAPFMLAFCRWLAAIAFMLPFAWRYLWRDWREIRRHLPILFLLGAIGTGTHNALGYLGLNFTTATNGVILNSFIPILIIGLSWIFLRERLSARQWAGVLISLTGVITILSHGNLEGLMRFRFNIGDVFVLSGMLMWATYTILLRKRPNILHPLSFLLVLACVGVIVLVPFVVVERWLGYRSQFTAETLSAIAFVGLLPSVLAYIFWNRGVKEVGANVAGLFVHLMPVFGSVLAWLFLNERFRLYHFLGIALILGGIYVTSRRGGEAAGAET